MTHVEYGLFLAVGIFVLLFASLIFWQFRLKRKLVKDLEKINAELYEKNQRLEVNNEFHKKLIAILSHDLRQPFSMLEMSSDKMLEDLTPEEWNLLFSEMKRSASVSLQVMDGLLHWMKSQALGEHYRIESTSLLDNIQTAIEFNDPLLRQKNLRVEFRLDDALCVQAQREMLLFIHRNMLHNAFKYSPMDGRIVISATLQENRVVIVQVSDEGSGIDEDVMKYLFKKRSPKVTDENGAGIALIICAEMMRKMNGRLWAENHTDGPGASFFYELGLG